MEADEETAGLALASWWEDVVWISSSTMHLPSADKDCETITADRCDDLAKIPKVDSVRPANGFSSRVQARFALASELEVALRFDIVEDNQQNERSWVPTELG